MSRNRIKPLIAAVLMNIFVIAYAINEIGVNRVLLILIPVIFISTILLVNIKKIVIF